MKSLGLKSLEGLPRSFRSLQTPYFGEAGAAIPSPVSSLIGELAVSVTRRDTDLLRDLCDGKGQNPLREGRRNQLERRIVAGRDVSGRGFLHAPTQRRGRGAVLDVHGELRYRSRQNHLDQPDSALSSPTAIATPVSAPHGNARNLSRSDLVRWRIAEIQPLLKSGPLTAPLPTFRPQCRLIAFASASTTLKRAQYPGLEHDP